MTDIEKEIREAKVRLCLDCGKCTSVCPVSQYDPGFNPRLIIQRQLQPAENKRKADDTIWSCLECRMCFERCDHRVKFPEFVRALRADSFSAGSQVQCSHGGTLQTLMRMMARPGPRQARLDWLPRDIRLHAGGTLFFVGCAPYLDVLFKDLGAKTLDSVEAALRLLNRAEVPFDLSPNEACCGHDLLLQGDKEGFVALARANNEDFKKRGIKKIITNCPECYYTLKIDYPEVLGRTGFEVVHLTEVLASLIKDKKLSLCKLEKRVTFHDPCTLGRGLRVFDAPRQVLESIPGLELVEMESNREQSLCCGASAWVHCSAVSRQIQEQRLSQAAASKADVLVTACPKCQIHLKCAQKCENISIPPVEIQDLAFLAMQAIDRR
ncbi:MAG: (Fe-S)-binding protein [Chloroflexota bacterium]